MKKLVLSAFVTFALISGTMVEAQQKTAPTYVSTVEGIKEYTLPNGLKVLLIADNSQSNAIVNIVYNVGSKNEGYGEKGMAHLLEHMLFKSTKKLGDIKKLLSEKGGNANGTTWLDRTNYFEIFPASDDNLKWFIEMESDRMINATMLQTDLDKEFSVVRNEFEIGENSPSSILMERIVSSAYLWHNYGNSTIGSKEDIERVKADRLKVFYQKYYQPDNATLIVAGKFDEKKALQYISDYFSVIPKPSRILEKTYTVEPAQDGEREVVLKRAGDVQQIGALYHTAAFADKDYAAIDVLGDILSADPTGYIYKALVDKQLASSVYAWQPVTHDPGFIYFSIEVPKDKSLDEAKKALNAQLAEIGTRKYTQQDLDRAKAKLLKNIENTQNNTINFTIDMTEYIGAGSYKLAGMYRDNIEKLTLEDIQNVAKKYFRNNNLTIGYFIPSGAEERVKGKEYTDEDIASLIKDYKGQSVDEEVATFDATISNIQKNTTEGKLSNGFKYAIVKKPIKGKKVVASLRFPLGDLKSLENKSNVADLLSNMLKSGTSKMTKEEIQDYLDINKSSLYFGFGGQSLYVSIDTYQDKLEGVLDLVNKLLTDSTFSEEELKKSKLELKTMYEANENDPQNIVFTELSRKSNNYPKSHPFYTESARESIEGLNAVTRAQILDLYKNLVGTSAGVGSVIGDLDATATAKLLETDLGKIVAKVPYKKIEPAFYQTKKSEERVQTNDKENAASISVSTFKMDRQSADYPAMVMADAMLGSGGFLTARIPTRLREKEGISYGAGSGLNVPYDSNNSSWYTYAFLNPTKIDLVEKATKEEIANAINRGFTAEEFSKTLTSWLNERKTYLGIDRQVANILNIHLFYGDPLSDYDKLESQISTLKVDQINAVIKKYLKPNDFVVVSAGDFTKK